MSLFDLIADTLRPEVNMISDQPEKKATRMYYITLRTGYGTKEWRTTNSIAAMEFTHSFGTIGFGLWSKPYNGVEINNVIAV